MIRMLKSIEEATLRMSQQGRWKSARNKEKDSEEIISLRDKVEQAITLFDVRIIAKSFRAHLFAN